MEVKQQEEFLKVHRRVEDLGKRLGRRPRILLSKVGQDGHDRGLKVVATSFADLGFDVDLGGMFQTPWSVVKQAVENDVHILGISTLAGSHMSLVSKVMTHLREMGSEGMMVVVGGIVPPDDEARLREAGVQCVFGPGTPITQSACQILDAMEVGLKESTGQDNAGFDVGSRVGLARAITQIESGSEAVREGMINLIRGQTLPSERSTVRVAITGAPGVGKSSLVEAMGMYLVEQGNRVAVLAIDPSSSLSGGSLLGDKTRMMRLAAEENAFIRPSPSGTHLGGVVPGTEWAIRLCEMAGYDVVLVETVGVGQLETRVSQWVDFLLLVSLPNAGDEVQAMKRGMMEVADGVVIHKADGGLKGMADRARSELEGTLGWMGRRRSGWKPRVVTCSSLEGNGVEAIWDMIKESLRVRAEVEPIQRD